MAYVEDNDFTNIVDDLYERSNKTDEQLAKKFTKFKNVTNDLYRKVEEVDERIEWVQKVLGEKFAKLQDRVSKNAEETETKPDPVLKLSPCPFCRKTDKLGVIKSSVSGSWWVECQHFDCEASGPIRMTRANAVNVWSEVSRKVVV